jgi:deoxyinosine 3'endonuclease (endonuclease V)
VIQFFLLAPYVGFEAVRHLVGAEHPDVSVLGMALTAASLVGMPFLGIAKQRLAERLGSSATHGEGSQNLICAYLAGAVFLGLAGNEVFGWWWLDRSRRSRSLASRSGRAPRPGAGRLLRRPGAHPGGRLRGRLLRVAPVV